MYLLLLLIVFAGLAVALRAGDLREWWLSRSSLHSLKTAAESSSADALTHFSYAQKLYAAGRREDAVSEYRLAADALAAGASDRLAQRTHARLGYLLARSGREEEAAPELERAIKLDDEDPIAHLGLGIVFMRRQMVLYAKNHFKLVVELEPQNVEGWYRLGAACNQNLEPQEAVEALQHAVALAPTDAASHVELGHAYAFQARFNLAVPEFRRAAELDPKNAGYREALGAALGMNARSRQEYKQAASLLEEAHRNNPANDSLLFTLGALHLRFNALPQARAYLELSVKRQPGNAEIWYNLSMAEQRLGNRAAADRDRAEFQRLSRIQGDLAVREKRVSASPRDPSLRVALARRYRAAGNIVGAYWQYKTALKLRPGQPAVQREYDAAERRMSQMKSVRMSFTPGTRNTTGPPPPPELMRSLR